MNKNRRSQNLGLAAETQHPAQHIFQTPDLDSLLNPRAHGIQLGNFLRRMPTPFLGQPGRIVFKLYPDQMADVIASHTPNAKRSLQVVAAIEAQRALQTFA